MKSYFYKMAAIFLILCLLPTYSLAETSEKPNYKMDKNVRYNVAIEKDEQIYISLRAFFKELGAPIIWDQKTKTVKVYYKNTLIEYKAGSIEAKVNDVKRKMESAPFLLKGTLYIPLKDTAEFISSSITKTEIDRIQMKYFWGFNLEPYINLDNLEGKDYENVVIPYGKYTVEDAWKIVDRYQGNYVRENVVTEFKGMDGDYYLFHTYFIPEYNGSYENFAPKSKVLTDSKYERILWNRYLVHKETGELKVDY